MSKVEYWAVGRANSVPLSLTQAEISRALIADWLPTLSFAASRSVLGWPYYLLDVESGAIHPYLVLKSIAGWSDRQWKGVLSWMIGIAGTRRVLNEEKYVWIAPLSAFYPNRRQQVATPFWHSGYPPSVLTIESDPSNSSRLRPDYVAARPSSGGNPEFAIVESKGTSISLSNLVVCPTDWARQVRNAIAKVNNLPFPIPRYLVVATRCNPNAIRDRSRRLQTRAWNSQTTASPDSRDMLVELMAAHYSGLCRNLALWANFRSLQLATLSRAIRNSVSSNLLVELGQEADQEFEKNGDWQSSGHRDGYFAIETDLGTIQIQVSTHAISILRLLRSGIPADDLIGEIMEHSHSLTTWYSNMCVQFEGSPDIAVDRSGFLVKTGRMLLPNNR
jgi:hypothetical protein